MKCYKCGEETDYITTALPEGGVGDLIILPICKRGCKNDNLKTKSINNITKYNENMINLIKDKLSIYNKSRFKGYKEDIKDTYQRLESIKEVLATMNIDLEIDYNFGTATFNDLNNNFKIEI